MPLGMGPPADRDRAAEVLIGTAVGTYLLARRWHAGPRAHPCRCDRPGVGPGLACWFVVEPPAGIEPATPSLPSMLGEFTTPCRTSRAHTTTLVRGAVEGWVVGRRQVPRSTVSGKSLARAPSGVVWPGMNADPGGPRPPATGTSGALLSSDDFRVERRANGDASSVMARTVRRLLLVVSGRASWEGICGLDQLGGGVSRAAGRSRSQCDAGSPLQARSW
jgi:hypothetical protein